MIDEKNDIKYWFYDNTKNVKGNRISEDDLDRGVSSFYEAYGIQDSLEKKESFYVKVPMLKTTTFRSWMKAL